jgi:hypothetical protein
LRQFTKSFRTAHKNSLLEVGIGNPGDENILRD